MENMQHPITEDTYLCGVLTCCRFLTYIHVALGRQQHLRFLSEKTQTVACSLGLSLHVPHPLRATSVGPPPGRADALAALRILG